MLRLDGNDWHPATADPSLLLNLAAAFVDCLRGAADDQGGDVGFRGIELRDRCVELAFPVQDIALARVAAQHIAVAAKAADAEGSGVLRRLRLALRLLPPGVKVRAQAGSWKRRLQPIAEPEELSTDELVTLRVRAIRAGGVQPAIRFEADDLTPFTLTTDEATVRLIGPNLYREMEIEAEVERGRDDQIVSGTLRRFDLVDADDADDAWSKWFNANADEWDDESIDALTKRP